MRQHIDASAADHEIDALIGLAAASRLLGNADEGIAARDRALAILDARGDGETLARARASASSVAQLSRDPARELALAERAVAIFATDFLEFPLPSSRYKVFANIPFAITTAIVSKLTTGVSPPDDAWLVMQREAAQRFLGEPGGTLVSALLHPWFASQIRHTFRRSDFVPQPGVDVVLLNLARRPQPLITGEREEAFRDLVTFAYTAWQPTVLAALATVLRKADCTRIEHGAELDLRRPPSSLAGDEWVALALVTQACLPQLPAAVRGAAARLERQQANLQPRPRSRPTG